MSSVNVVKTNLKKYNHYNKKCCVYTDDDPMQGGYSHIFADIITDKRNKYMYSL